MKIQKHMVYCGTGMFVGMFLSACWDVGLIAFFFGSLISGVLLTWLDHHYEAKQKRGHECKAGPS